MRLRPFDFAAIALAIAVVVASSIAAYAPGGGEPSAVISGDGGQWVYPLKKDRELEVAGPLGATLVEIVGGAVRVADSPCPNKTCVATGAISRPGQWIACLPNRVFVRVEGSIADDGIDAGTY